MVPAERCPRAARERFARPPAGTALAPHLDRIRNAPFGERDSNNVYVTENRTFVKTASLKMIRTLIPFTAGLDPTVHADFRPIRRTGQRTISSRKSRQLGLRERIRSILHARDQCLTFFSP